MQSQFRDNIFASAAGAGNEMDFKPPPFDSTLDQYQRQAEELFEAHKSGDSQAIRLIYEHHPRFLDSKILWLPKNLSDSEIQSAPFDLADAQLTVAQTQSLQLANFTRRLNACQKRF
jgi:hypothetical protein